MVTRFIFVLVSAAFVLSGCARQNAVPKTDCNLAAGACVKSLQGNRVSFDVLPKPVASMTELVFTVSLSANGRPFKAEHVSLDLTMPGMYMGANRPALTLGEDGKYSGKGILPRCPSGQKIWKAEIVIERPSSGEAPLKTSFLFETGA